MNSKSLFKWHHFAPDIILWGVRSFLPLSDQLLSVVRDDVRAGNGSRPQYAVPLGPEVCARNRISGKENRTDVRFNKNSDVKLHPEQAKTALEQWSNAPESKQQTKAASRLAKQLPQFLGLLEAAIRE